MKRYHWIGTKNEEEEIIIQNVLEKYLGKKYFSQYTNCFERREFEVYCSKKKWKLIKSILRLTKYHGHHMEN